TKELVMQSLLQAIRQNKFWGERSLRERRLLLATGSVVSLAAIFLVLIEPALAGRQYWQQALPASRAEYAQMKSLAEQLGKTPPSAVTDIPRADSQSIERSLADAGIKPASIQITDQQLTAEWIDISFSALIQWLQETQRERAWLVAEATVTAKEAIDRVDAKIEMRPSRSVP
ncbi:MAG: type II secretion system protein GspM, partial [Burkholderiaceae bacterium]